MSYYNHFAFEKYLAVGFADLKVGDKFRKDLFNGKKRRRDIIMIKTGDLSYIEQRSKKEHILFTPNIYVSSFDRLRKSNSEQNPERSVATMPNSSNEADNQIKQNPLDGG
jgi:hypothetical protein